MANEVYVGTGVGTADWTTDLTGLTSLTVDNITINGNQITSDTGTVNFNNDHLTSTGNLTVGQIAAKSATFPVGMSTRTTTATNATRVAAQIVTESSGDMTSGFGTGFLFAVSDTGVSNSVLAGIFAIRGSADDIGSLEFYTANGGAITSKGRFAADGTFIVDGSIEIDGAIENTSGSDASYLDGILVSGTTTASTKTGTCVIDLPQDFTKQTMMVLKIRGYNYSDASGAWEVLFGGYSYNPSNNKTWLKTNASICGKPPFVQIRAGYNGNTGKACIMLGNTGLVWSTPQVQLLDMFAGFTSTTGWGPGWAINWYTDETNFFNNDPIYNDPVVVDWKQDFESPTVDDQVLISTGNRMASWSTAGADQVLASDGSGIVTWADKPFGYSIPANSAQYQVFVGTGAGTADWTTDLTGLTSLTVDNITINGNQITSDTGTVNFNNDHLTSTGNITAGQIAAKSDTFPVGMSTRTTTATNATRVAAQIVTESSGDMTSGFGTGFLFAVSDTGVSNSVLAGIFAIRGSADDIGSLEFYTANGGAITSKGRFAADGTFIVDGSIFSALLTVDNITIDAATITSDTGAISFVDENLTTSGTVVGSNIPSPTVDDQVLISTASGVASWSTAGADQYLASDGSGAVAWADKVWTSTLSANATLYVRTTGNDSTGDGSPGDPYLTLAKVIQVIGKLYIGSYTVTVDIGEGVFTETGTLAFIHPFGQQVTWQGVSESIASQTIASVGAGTDYGHSGLYYHDCTIVLPVGKSVSVDDYIGISSASGGTNPGAMCGVHRVVTWVGGSRTATIRQVYNNGSETPSGTITVDIDLIKSVIAFSDKNGIKVTGPYSAGVWRGLVIQGDYDGANNAKYGVWSLNGAVVSLGGSSASGAACGLHGFKTSVYAQNNALVFADYGYMSTGGQHQCSAQNGGILGLRLTKISGCGNSGIFAFNGSTVAANGCTIVGTGNNSVLSYQGSFIDISDAFVGESDSTTSILADRWSGVDATGATVDNNLSPASNPGNDGSYIIV